MIQLVFQVALLMLVYCGRIRSEDLSERKYLGRDGLTNSPGVGEISQSLTKSPQDHQRIASAVAAQQREGMVFWILVVGGAGLGAIILLSVVTVLWASRSKKFHLGNKKEIVKEDSMHHKTYQEVEGAVNTGKCGIISADVREKSGKTTQLSVPGSQRVAQSIISWGSEFDVLEVPPENIYSNSSLPKASNHSNQHSPTAGSLYSNLMIHTEGTLHTEPQPEINEGAFRNFRLSTFRKQARSSLRKLKVNEIRSYNNNKGSSLKSSNAADLTRANGHQKDKSESLDLNRKLTITETRNKNTQLYVNQEKLNKTSTLPVEIYVNGVAQ